MEKNKNLKESTIKRIFLVIGFLVIAAAIFIFWGGNRIAKNTQVNKIDVYSKADGVYHGSYTISPVYVELDVTIKDKKITDIKILKHTNGIGFRAEGPVIKAIIDKQSNDVDIVSGASVSSKAIMGAVWDALK
ncbi:MAG: FMN-binding protein [Clostridiaceae bacterium]